MEKKLHVSEIFKRVLALALVFAMVLCYVPVGASAEEAAYYVAGVPALCGSEWNPGDEANKMTLNDEGLYEKSYEDVPAGTYEFKITTGSWESECWGDNGNNYKFTLLEAQDVTITFNAETKEIKTNAPDAGEPETPVEATYIVAGTEGLCGSGWNPGDTANKMTLNSDGLYEKTYTQVDAGEHKFKITDGTWMNCWGDGHDSDGNTVLNLETTSDVTILFNAETKEITVNVVAVEKAPGPVAIKVHYTREDGNYEGWNVFQWGGIEVTEFEVGENEAVATIYANANTSEIGFIVRQTVDGNEWGNREWVTEGSGDRKVEEVFPELPNVKSGTIHVYVDSANPSVTNAEAGDDVVYGAPEVVDYDITIKVHYYRPDGNYSDWEVHMWNGVESLNSTRAFELEDVTYEGTTYGATATYYADASDTWVGFIIKKPDWTKDPDGDRKIDVSDVLSGTVHVYAKSGSALEDFVTDKSEATRGAKVTAAIYDSLAETLTVTTSMPIEGELDDVFTLEGPDGEMTITSVTQIEGSSNYLVEYEGEINADEIFTVYYNGAPCVVTVPNIYSTEQFESEYTYTGNDLGATWSKKSTTFRLWAPTASKVDLNLYSTGDAGDDSWLFSYGMTKDVNGTWVVTVNSNLHGVYYTYSVTRRGETVEACDPYAKATGVNGNRAMVIDLDSTDPAGWENDTYVTQDNYTDAVIWELHVRDFSIDASSGVSEANRGKYLAFTEKGTTVNGEGEIATGIDYMVDLGVNYVHLLPVYDINSVDETQGGYNWGYDPKNYNVPEGSYSSNPYDGEVRVNEFKQMVKSLHDNGIGVIMDVVYNHVADASGFCFNQIVPGYFSRVHDDGSYQSNSGCGNDTASERSMVSKYIVDSVLYWNTEYHIDGFRWDLVGLIDYETINAVMAAVHEVNPDIIFYGEGWEMCSWTTKEDAEPPYSKRMTIQNNDKMVNTEAGVFAFFNDTIRNVIHGGVFNATDKGFVSGNMNEGTRKTIIDGYMANSVWGSAGETVDTPLQTINYASCHDNYTLFDNLTIDAMDATGKTAAEVKEQAAAMNNLAAAYYITAQGVPFIHAGEEMLRSKPDAQQENGFNHNSYASGDEINSIKWYTLADETVDAAHDYYQGLIAFRAAHASMRMTEEAAVLEAMSALETDNVNVIAILNNGGEEEIISIFNADGASHTVTLPEGKWNVYVNKEAAGTEILASVEGEVEIEATSAMILVKAEAEEEEPSVPSTPVVPSWKSWLDKIVEKIKDKFPVKPSEPSEPSEPETEPSEPETEPSEPSEPSVPVKPIVPIWKWFFGWLH